MTIQSPCIVNTGGLVDVVVTLLGRGETLSACTLLAHHMVYTLPPTKHAPAGMHVGTLKPPSSSRIVGHPAKCKEGHTYIIHVATYQFNLFSLRVFFTGIFHESCEGACWRLVDWALIHTVLIRKIFDQRVFLGPVDGMFVRACVCAGMHGVCACKCACRLYP